MKIIKQLGEKGSEAVVFLIESKRKKYALRIIENMKPLRDFQREASYQKRCAGRNISPKVFLIDDSTQTIVMELMDTHLTTELRRNGRLTKKHQKEIIEILDILDDLKIFHGDANLLNYMVKDNKVFIIDFGMAQDVTDELVQSLGTSTPNRDLGLLAITLKLKDSRIHPSGYSILSEALGNKLAKVC